LSDVAESTAAEAIDIVLELTETDPTVSRFSPGGDVTGHFCQFCELQEHEGLADKHQDTCLWERAWNVRKRVYVAGLRAFMAKADARCVRQDPPK
jgi:hypothetical protein